MITLDAPFVTTISHTIGSESKVITTDTLCVSLVWIDLVAKTLTAKILRGTMVDGTFVENMASLQVTVNKDGTFSSSDGTWAGTVAPAPALLDALRSEFDSFILASGAVTGTPTA